MEKVNLIKENLTYKQILKESFGGIMYSVANVGKYNATEILRLWRGLTASEQNAAGGIMKGVFDFLTTKE